MRIGDQCEPSWETRSGRGCLPCEMAKRATSAEAWRRGSLRSMKLQIRTWRVVLEKRASNKLLVESRIV